MPCFFAFSSLRRWSAAVWLLLTLLLAGRAARAQAPTLTGLSPTRNARSAAVTASPAFTFSQPMSNGAATLGAVKVFSSQRGGRLQNGARGTATASGNTLTFDPTNDFRPGETLFSTVTTAAQSGTGAALAAGRVQQFTAAVGGTGRGNFRPGTDPAVGSNPFSVAVGDVDGDGDLDILAANRNASGTVSLRLNGGDASGSNTGSFAGGTDVPVGNNPRSVALADVDGDGDLDILAANDNASGTVSLRLNDGAGNYGAPATNAEIAVGNSPFALAVGDVDGDGDLDVVTTNFGSASASVRLNGGDASGSNTGVFANGSDPAVGTTPVAVALADVDGDGDLDLLASNQSGTANVRLNGGDASGSNTGSFAGGGGIAVGGLGIGVAVGDVDGDGDLDFVTGNITGSAVSVRLNGGDASGSNTGVFGGGSNPAVGGRSFSVALADVDGDGDLDLLASNNNSAANAVSLRLNDGTGTFAAPATNPEIATGANPRALALADVDNDGDLDLLTANSGGAGVSVRLNQPPAPTITSFAPLSGPVGTLVTVTGTNLAGTTAVTVNGTAGTISGTPTATSLTFTVGAGSTTGVVSVTTPGGSVSSTGSFTVTPLLTLTGLSPTRNQRNAAATASPAFTFDQAMSGGASSLLGVKVFSQQRGGRLQNGAGGSTTVSNSTLTFDPTNDFRPGETVFSTVTTAAQSGTGAALAAGRVQQFTTAVGGTGRGSFQPGPSADPAVGTSPRSVAVGDVDGDGDLDFVTANANATGTVSVRLNGGDNLGTNTGTFSNGGSVSVGNNPGSVVLADVDGDGDLDLLTANPNNVGTVSVRLNGGNNLGGGTGTFTGGADVAVGSSPRAVALADVDGDGDLDLLAANGGTTGTVSVRLNGGDATGSNTGTFAGGSEVAVGNQPRGVALGDVDGDGDLDLLVTNSRGNTVSVRLNGGNDLGTNTGAFSGGSDVAVGNAPFGVALADVDNDGDLDLLTANANSPGTVSVRLNGGDATGSNTGSFSNGSDPAVGSSPFGLAVGDVDNDGDLDLLAANFGGGTVSVRLNGGDATGSNPGAFSNGSDPAVGSSPFGVALGDVDGDGDLDLLTANSTNAGTVSVRLNQPPPVPSITSFAPASGPVGTVVTVTGTNLAGATAASVNGTAGTGLTANTATGLTFTVGAGSSTGVVSITTPGGTASSTASFTVVPLLTLTGLSPTRNQRSAAATASPAFTFDQPMSGGASSLLGVKVFSSQRGGRLQNGAQGTTTASTNTLTFTPTTAFKPGETLFSTVTTAAQSGTGAVLAAGRVQQFTTAVGGTGRGNFRPGTDPAVGTFPIGVAVGDVDGDGDLDLLTANYLVGTASVRLNGGNNLSGGTGTFSNGSDVAVGDRPFSVAVGDVDGDGDLDLLAANAGAGTNTVSVRLNGGNNLGGGTGSFSGGSDVAVGSGPRSLALADVDGDGDLDLLAANYDGGTVSVRLNGGNATGSNTGTFSNGSTVNVGSQPTSVAVGDVDGDGDLDLLAPLNNFAGTVSVRLNGGDATGSNTGIFSNGSNPAVGSQPQSVAVADVDGDGDLDLLTANASTAGTVSVRLNGGNNLGGGTGTFSGGSDPAVGANPFGLAVGDVDNDGDLDLLTANFSGGTVSVRLNGGNNLGGGTGTFSGGSDPAVGNSPFSVAVGDVDGDGDLDLLAANNGTSTVSVRLNQPLPPVITSFAPASGPVGTVVTVTGTGLAGATAATVNGTAGTGLSGNTATGLSFIVGAGSSTGAVSLITPGGTASSTGSFTVVPLLTLTGLSPARNVRNAAVGTNLDFTFDQPMDNTPATLGAVKVFSQQRGGRMQNLARGTTSVANNTLTFNPDNDFKPGEILFSTVTTAALASSTGAALAAGRVQQFTAATGGSGRGNFRPGTNPGVGSAPVSVAVGDVDGDGDLDFVTANANNVGTVSVGLNGGNSLGGGTGTFVGGGSTVSVGASPRGVVLGDVDGDGDLDLLTANYADNNVSVCLNGGDGTGLNAGTFTPGGTTTVSVDFQPQSVALGDVDGDGDLDLLTANQNSTAGTVSVRLNGGDATGSNTGTFGGGGSVSVDGNPQSVVLGDVDGDGDLDLVTPNSFGGKVSVRLNGGNNSGTNTGVFSNGTNLSTGTIPQSVALGDVDGDGDLDLLVADNNDNNVSVRLNGGNSTGSNTGVFAAASNSGVTVGGGPRSVALADVDADGDLDLVTANLSGTVSVRLNSGLGVFGGSSDVAAGIRPYALALGDLDGDDDLDLVTPNNVAVGSAVSVFLNQPPAPVITSFAPASGPVGTVVTITGTNLAGATAASVNGAAGTGLSANTATSLTFVVGAGSTTGVVSVTTPGGTASSTGSFTVVPLLTLTALSPTRNQRNAAVGTNLDFTFDQPMSGAAGSLLAVKVFSSQRGGRLQNGAGGSTTQSGSTLTFNPTNDFKPGETVFSTVTTAALGLSTGAALAAGRVQQFTTAVGGTGRGNFLAGTNPRVGTNPYAVVLGDVDGDGDLDLLAANLASNTVSVRLNGSDNTGTNTGTFAGGSSVSVGSLPISVALGDVDGDGDLDFVTANANDNTVSVRLNDGSGTFAAPPTAPEVAVGNSPYSVALGDVDGDGDLDLLAANDNTAGTVSVCLNGGDNTGSNTGTFGARADVAVGSRPRRVVLADVDGDGDLDFVTANLTGNTVSVRLNGGDNTGSFSNGSDPAVGSRPQSVALGDVDGDGDLDLVTANDINFVPGTVSVCLNGGDNTGSNTGTFGARADVAVGSRPFSVALGDVDGDGDLDFVTANGSDDNVSVRLNGGDATGSNTGSFSNGSDPAVGDFPFNVALADVDGDGDLDLLTANISAGTVSVRLNQPPVPVLTALSPAAELPGQAVTLTGTGFAAGSTVTFGGVAAASVTVTSATSITAVVPVGAAPGNRAVVVSGPAGPSPSSPAFEVLQVYRNTAASGCLTTDPLTLTGTGGTGAWRYLRLPGTGGAVVAAIEDTQNLGTVTAGLNALGTATATAVRQDGAAGRRYLDRNFYLTATNPAFTGQTVRVRLFGLNAELARLTAADANATLLTLNASQYDGANVNCTLNDNDPAGQRRLLAAPATALAGADWFTAQLAVADHFSEFYLTGASAPLPVELLTFTATASGPAAVALAWTTASERNSARFDIERSADGRAFARIGEVAAQGTKTTPTSYTYLDEKLTSSPSRQLTYYRLRQVDLDGSFSYSPVRAVQRTPSPIHQLTISPNPAREAVAVGGATAGAEVAVFDALGRRVAGATADAAGTARLALPVGLAAGVYVVKCGSQARRLAVE